MCVYLSLYVYIYTYMMEHARSAVQDSQGVATEQARLIVVIISRNMITVTITIVTIIIIIVIMIIIISIIIIITLYVVLSLRSAVPDEFSQTDVDC